MKRRHLILGSALLPLLAACGSSGDGGDTGNGGGGAGSGAIRAGSTGQSYPNSYKEGGTLIGFDVEIIEKVAEALGRTVEWTNADFSGLMGQLEAGRLETVANNVAVTEERAATYDFTAPYAYMGATIVALEDNAEITTLEDLEGRTVGGVLGSNNVKHLEAWQEETGITVDLRTYETRDGAYQDVLNGRIDGYINSTGVLFAEIKRTSAPLKFIGEPIAWEAVALPFAKGSELTAQVSEQIEALRADGTLSELSVKYYGEDVSQEPGSQAGRASDGGDASDAGDASDGGS